MPAFDGSWSIGHGGPNDQCHTAPVTDQVSDEADELQRRDRPDSPYAALIPGVLLVAAGLWMVGGGAPLALGWSAFAVGLACLIVGGVAQGVAWGLDIHDRRGR